MDKLQQCARDLIEITPQVMRSIRSEMRSRRTLDLSVPQFRTLAFIHAHTNVSLTGVAHHIGLTLASTSRLVDGLVKKGLVIRQESPTDRRRLTLVLTGPGATILDAAVAGAQAHLQKILLPLPADQLDLISRAFELLHPLFAAESHALETKIPD